MLVCVCAHFSHILSIIWPVEGGEGGWRVLAEIVKAEPMKSALNLFKVSLTMQRVFASFSRWFQLNCIKALELSNDDADNDDDDSPIG